MKADGDGKRISSFLAAEWNRLVHYVRSRIADSAEADAEDIVQEVLAGLFERSDMGAPIVDFSAYLYRSLRNRIIDAHRRPARMMRLTGAVADARFEASSLLESEDMRKELLSGIDALSPSQKAVLVAIELEGRSFRELSEEWETPMGTLLARKHRAVRSLRKTLAGGHE